MKPARFDASSEVWVLPREQGALGLDADMGMEAFLGRGSQDDPSLGRNSHSSWFNAKYIYIYIIMQRIYLQFTNK